MKKFIVVIAILLLAVSGKAQVSANIPRVPAWVFPIGPFAGQIEQLDPYYSLANGGHSPPWSMDAQGLWYVPDVLTILKQSGWNLWYNPWEGGPFLDNNSGAGGKMLA